MEQGSQATENDEKKYVTLETGSKLSGYTQDYLERLCRLKKIDYRLWNNGQFVIELESLLRETQTILLSHDGISFVDKGELADPVPQVVGSVLSSASKGVKTPIAMPMPAASTPAFAAGVERAPQVVLPTPASSIPVAPRPIKINAVESTLIALDTQAPAPSVVPQASLVSIASEEEVDISVPNKKETPPIEIAHAEVSGVTPVSEKQTVPFGSWSEQEEAKEEVVPKAASHDDWDALLFGGNDAARATSREPSSTPQKTLSINSTYHPIQTSVDPRSHYDDAPLFPILSPNGVTRQENVGPKSDTVAPSISVMPAESPMPESHDMSTRVVVYAPEDLLRDKSTDEAPTEIPVSVSQEQGVINHELPPAPTIIVVPKPIPAVPVEIIRKTGTIPSLRVMPNLPVVQQKNLPMKADKHRVILEEEHSLTKSVGLNLAFAAVVIGSSLLLLNSTFPDLGKKLGGLTSTFYVASVGAVPTTDAPISVPPVLKNADELALPFSDEVIVYPGSKPNSVIVRPVFKTRVGSSYEYALTPIVATSTNVK